jgi:hypothetical protein
MTTEGIIAQVEIIHLIVIPIFFLKKKR